MFQTRRLHLQRKRLTATMATAIGAKYTRAKNIPITSTPCIYCVACPRLLVCLRVVRGTRLYFWAFCVFGHPGILAGSAVCGGALPAAKVVGRPRKTTFFPRAPFDSYSDAHLASSFFPSLPRFSPVWIDRPGQRLCVTLLLI